MLHGHWKDLRSLINSLVKVVGGNMCEFGTKSPAPNITPVTALTLVSEERA